MCPKILYILLILKYVHDITTSWQELKIENDLCDVTLASEDNQIKAYIIILSSYGLY